jgi:hypothetical protein
VPVLAIDRTDLSFDEWAADFAARNEQSAPHYVSSMQQHGPWSRGGNAIFSLASLPLESSNCQAQICTCFCQNEADVLREI